MESVGRLWAVSLAYLAAHGSEARLAVRVAVAGVVTFAIASMLGLAQGYWAVFTAVIVMQASLGGSVKATVDRLIGTIGGALYGGAVALLVANTNAITVGAGLILALLPLAYLAAIDARFRVAPVTAVIVLVSPFGQEVSPVWFTLDRILEIGLGSIVALIVSLTILPARAHNLLADSAGKLLTLCADFFALILGGLAAPVDAAELRRLQMATRRTLVALEGAADEASRERSAHLSDAPDPEPVARTSLRVRNDLIMVARALTVPPPSTLTARIEPHVTTLAREGAAYLRGLATAFRQQTAPPSLEAFDAALRAYHGEIAALRSERAFADLPADVVGRMFALGFALDQFRKDLGDLADRAAEFARPVAASSI